MAVEATLDENNLNADVSALGDDQVAELYAISQSEGGADRAKMIGVLEGAGYRTMDLGEETIFIAVDMPEIAANELRDEVEQTLGTYGYDIEADTLTEDQVAKIYAAVQNSDDNAVRGKIATILQ